MRGLGREFRGLVIGVLLGTLVSGSAAFGYAMLNAWRDFGPDFQLGYVVGYFDGVTLGKRHDTRGYVSWLKIPYERWRDEVNKYYQDETHKRDPLPTAMHEVYVRFVTEKYPEIGRRWRMLMPRKPGPAPTPAGGAASQNPPAAD